MGSDEQTLTDLSPYVGLQDRTLLASQQLQSNRVMLPTQDQLTHSNKVSQRKLLNSDQYSKAGTNSTKQF